MSRVQVTRVTGDFRAPHNAFRNADNSIHNDAVASRLGFRGGTVPGSVHMDQFVPLLLDCHGPEWFASGGLSLYFTHATTDGEEVRAVLEAEDARDRLTMYNRAGDLICTGTANVGGVDGDSELARRMDKSAPAGDETLRILRGTRVGDTTGGVPMRVDGADLADAMARITERVPAYQEGVLPPSHIIKLTHVVKGKVLTASGSPVGLFGALEVQQLAGPVYADTDYVGRTNILKLTESPKAENGWYEVIVADRAGRDVARVIYMIRIMKGSSPLWAV